MAIGATHKAAEQAIMLADISLRTARREARIATEVATKTARNEAKKGKCDGKTKCRSFPRKCGKGSRKCKEIG